MNKATSEIDQDFLKGIRSGDQNAFEKCFRKYYPELVGFALKTLKDKDQAEEIVQDTFVRFWEQKDTIDIQFSLKAYLYRSVHHACLNLFKHEKVREKHKSHTVHTSSEADDNDPVEYLELQTKIQTTIDQLPDRCREVFILSRHEGLKYSEIADKLNISIKTVENQMGKALKFLRQNLSDFLPLLIIVFDFLFF